MVDWLISDIVVLRNRDGLDEFSISRIPNDNFVLKPKKNMNYVRYFYTKNSQITNSEPQTQSFSLQLFFMLSKAM